MLNLTTGQLEGWLMQYFWPFVRIAAFVGTAPIFGARFIPARFKIALSGAITLLVAPMIVVPAGLTPMSPQGVVVTVQQLLIGLSIGFVFQVIFDSLAMGGQLLANSMGLSFAFNVDPQRGASTPVVGQLYMVLVTLSFVALDGHLALLEALIEGFTSMPVGGAGMGADHLWQVVLWGRQLFDGALMVALPGMTALLIVNLGFGVMSRAAPSLNMFAVGFPITLVFGIAIIMLGLPAVHSSFARLFEASVTYVNTLQSGN